MNYRAYIVDDSAIIRDSLASTLEELAQVRTVGTAETEEEGAAWLAQNDDQWDLAIVDLFLKEGSGLQVLYACRYRHPHQKIVVLSNHSSPAVRWKCVQLGADAVFDKSTELDALVNFCVTESQATNPAPLTKA